MEKTLVTYATMSGSTVGVAAAVAEQLASDGVQTALLPLEKVSSLEPYRAVVIGAPMIMGWHRTALNFLSGHRQAFQRIPLAIFATAMRLTATEQTSVNGVPLFIDERLARPMKVPGHPGLKERHASVTGYAAPILKAVSPARPVSLAFFGGCLDPSRLSLLPRLFVTYVVQAVPGDYRNWDAVRLWSARLSEQLGLGRRVEIWRIADAGASRIN